MIGPFEPMPSGTGIAPPRCHPPPDGGTLRHVNNSLPGPVSEGSVHGNGSRQPDNWLLALAEPFVTVLAHGNGVIVTCTCRSLGDYRHLGGRLKLHIALKIKAVGRLMTLSARQV